MKQNTKSRFGCGYRMIDRVECFSAKSFYPLVREEEITLDVDNVDLFRIEKVEHVDESQSYVRIRSDISMLFHAESTAKKIGTEGFRYLAESRRVKTSSTQSAMDNMPTDLILDTVKSRHLQHPSELLAFSEQLSCMAADMEEKYKRYVESQMDVADDTSGSKEDASAASSSSSSVPS
nr:MAG TPA: hypothetical protein [Microviridae sp.]